MKNRVRAAWFCARAKKAAREGKHADALALLEQVRALGCECAEDRALRALTLLHCQRVDEARAALEGLCKELKHSHEGDHGYLRRWSRATLALMRGRTRQFNFDAREAQYLAGGLRLKTQFPLQLPQDPGFRT